jgi:hypothetical protein
LFLELKKNHSSDKPQQNALNIPYIYEYITKLCKKEEKIKQNHGNANVRNIGQDESRHRKFKRLKLGDGQAYHRSSV